MGKDYYATLKVTKGAELKDIQAGFRQAVLRWHPNITPHDKEAAKEHFERACEAYEVLSNDLTRSVYDMFGYETLITGLNNKGEIVFPAYQYSNNSQKVYETFLVDSSPFGSLIDFDGRACEGSIFGMAALGMNWTKDTSPVHVLLTVECTLNELYNGCTKKVTYTRRVFSEDRRTTRPVEETKEIVIERGMKDGDDITILEGGSDKMDCERGNLVVSVKELPHERFVRKGDDLYVTITMSLLESLDVHFVKVNTLDGRRLKVSFDQSVTPELKLTVKDEGMPSSTGNGNLYINFEVTLPRKILPAAAAPTLKAVLPS